ncbi:hypothetical protein R6Z07F_019073 [Ovis aries]
MEFPDLGKRCSEKACRQLVTYAAHKGPLAFTKVIGWPGPVCPPCNSPVPVRRGESPDVAVGAHTGGDCRRPPGQETAKVFTSGCRREMLRAACEECRGSLCLQHRRPLDHGCARRAHPGSSAGCLEPRLWPARRFRRGPGQVGGTVTLSAHGAAPAWPLGLCAPSWPDGGEGVRQPAGSSVPGDPERHFTAGV